MATTKEITFDSINLVGKDGRHITLKIVDTPKPETNEHELKCTISTYGGPVNYYDTYCLVKIGDTRVYFSNGKSTCAGYKGWITYPDPNGIWVDAEGSSNTCAKKGFSQTKTITINHGKNKTKTVNVKFLVGIYYYVVKDCGGSFTLSEMNVEEENPPVITQNDPVRLAYNSYRISASSNVNCTHWVYQVRQKKNGKWDDEYGNPVSISTTGKSVEDTLTGLESNTSYRFRFKATGKNGEVGTSNTKTVKIPAPSTIESINGLSTPSIYTYNIKPSTIIPLVVGINCTNASVHHKIRIVKGTDDIIIRNIGKLNVGMNEVDLGLTLSDLNALIALFNATTLSNTPITSVLVQLDTYGDSNYSESNKIGSNSKEMSIQLDSVEFAPTITYDRYKDSNANSVAITGDDRYIIPEGNDITSIIQILNVNATNYAGTSISQSNISFGVVDGSSRTTITWSGKNVTFGTLPLGKNKIYIRATDSRGLTATKEIYLLIYREGEGIILQEDYQRWYDVLESIYTSKDGEGNYYITEPSKIAIGETIHAEFVNESAGTEVVKTLPVPPNNKYGFVLDITYYQNQGATPRKREVYIGSVYGNSKSFHNINARYSNNEITFTANAATRIVLIDIKDYVNPETIAFDLDNVAITDKVYYGEKEAKNNCVVTLTNPSIEELASVKYNGNTYYSRGDTFTVPNNDTIMFYAQGEQGADIYLNNVIVASVDTGRGTMYAYTANSKDINVAFDGDELVPEIYIDEIQSNSGSVDDVTGIGNLLDLTDTVYKIPHQLEEDYYYEAADEIEALKTQVDTVQVEDIISRYTKMAVDDAIDALDDIVLFNLIEV